MRNPKQQKLKHEDDVREVFKGRERMTGRELRRRLREERNMSSSSADDTVKRMSRKGREPPRIEPRGGYLRFMDHEEGEREARDENETLFIGMLEEALGDGLAAANAPGAVREGKLDLALKGISGLIRDKGRTGTGLAHVLTEALHRDLPIDHRRTVSDLLLGLMRNAKATTDGDETTLSFFRGALVAKEGSDWRGLMALAMDRSEDSEVRSNIIRLMGELGDGRCLTLLGMIEIVDDDEEYGRIQLPLLYFISRTYNENKVTVRDILFKYRTHESEHVRKRVERVLWEFPSIVHLGTINDRWPYPSFDRD